MVLKEVNWQMSLERSHLVNGLEIGHFIDGLERRNWSKEVIGRWP